MAKTLPVQSSRVDMFYVDPADLRIIGHDTAHKAGEHPLWDERASAPAEESMVRNIMAHGVIEPVVVRQDGDKLEVVAGRQRVKAARLANERLEKEGKKPLRVPVKSPMRGDDKDFLGVMISENEIRRDDEFRTKAAKALRLQKQGFTEDEIAVAFGVTDRAVQQWLTYHDLAPEVRRAVDKGEVAPSAALPLAKLPREEQQSALESLKASAPDGKVTQKEIAARVKATKNGDDDASARPGLRLLRKVVALSPDSGMDENVALTLRWVLGDLPPERIKGLKGVINAATGKED